MLADRRSLGYDGRKAAKIFMGIMALVLATYLLGTAVVLALAAKDSRMTAPELMCMCLPVMLVIDFAMRFAMQQTPSQIVKPYLLLPLPKDACIRQFVATSLMSVGNCTWLVVAVPFCLMAVLFGYGAWPSLLLIVFVWLLTMANSQWYAIARTLINSNLLWWALPLCVYAALFAPILLWPDDTSCSIMYLYTKAGSCITDGSPTPVVAALALLCAVTWANMRVQSTHVIGEITGSGKKEEHVETARWMGFLDRYGDTGQFVKLEIRLLARNKNPRRLFVFATLIVVAITAVMCVSDIYDTAVMTTFWCIYNFVVYGDMMLTRIMGYEANYIDCLMVRRENILSLLTAKYIVYCALLTVPLALMVPLVAVGKWSWLMLAGMALYTSGFQYFALFQLAVYNRQAMPLNTKLTSKTGTDNNYVQLLVQVVSFGLPLIIISVLGSVLSDTAAYAVLLVIGAGFTLTHRMWLRNIYGRMMKRRYDTMSAFRASR